MELWRTARANSSMHFDNLYFDEHVIKGILRLHLVSILALLNISLTHRELEKIKYNLLLQRIKLPLAK